MKVDYRALFYQILNNKGHKIWLTENSQHPQTLSESQKTLKNLKKTLNFLKKTLQILFLLKRGSPRGTPFFKKNGPNQDVTY